MGFRNLRRMVAETDEQHREAMRDIHDTLGELHFGGGEALAASRRSFLQRAATGGAIAFGATAVSVTALAQSALAQTGTTAAPATTIPKTPNLLKGEDVAVALFAHSIELAVAALYGTAIATGKLMTAPVAETYRTFTRHHLDHAKALQLLVEGDATDKPNNALLTTFTPQINAAGDEKALCKVFTGIENGAAATYAYALGILTTLEAAAAASRILPVEGQHAVVQSQMAAESVDAWASQLTTYVPVFQTDSGAFTPAAYAS